MTEHGSRDAANAGPAAAHAGAAAALILRGAARVGGAAAQAGALAARLERLAEEDARALAAARAVLPTGEGGGAPDARRDFALGRALEHAAAVPLAIAEACADVVALAEELAPLADPSVVADVEGARLLAAGAAAAASHLVEANLGVVPGDERLARARAAAGK